MTKATCKAYVGRVIPEKVRKKVVGGTQNHVNTSNREGGYLKSIDFKLDSGRGGKHKKTRNQKSNGKIKEIKFNTKYCRTGNRPF